MAVSDPDSRCHLQLALMPLRLDEWHFYESSQNRTGTGLNEDINMHIRGKTEVVKHGCAFFAVLL